MNKPLSTILSFQNCSQYHVDCIVSFTGKERDEETGYLYFGARYYDADLLTGWTSVDPLSDKYPSISSYAYCKRNPIGLIDIDGREIYYIEGMTKYVYKKSQDGVYGFYNSKTGDSYSGDASQYVNDLTAVLGKLQEGGLGAKLVGSFEGSIMMLKLVSLKKILRLNMVLVGIIERNHSFLWHAIKKMLFR